MVNKECKMILDIILVKTLYIFYCNKIIDMDKTIFLFFMNFLEKVVYRYTLLKNSKVIILFYYYSKEILIGTIIDNNVFSIVNIALNSITVANLKKVIKHYINIKKYTYFIKGS